jgi:hypothetical protein
MPEIERHGFRPAPDPRRLAELESVQVAEWCPTPDGTGPAEQVHLVLRVKGLEDLPLVMRFKTGPAVDAIADALLLHRQNVFGPRAV